MGKYFSRKAVRDIARWAGQNQEPRTIIAESSERHQQEKKAEEERQRELLRKRKRKLSGLSDEEIEAKERRFLSLPEKGE